MKTKKVLSFLLALCLLGGLTACGDSKAAPTKEAAPSDKATEVSEDIRWGIDIQGGVEAFFSPIDAAVVPTEAQLEAIKAILEQRLKAKSITDYEAVVDKTAGEVIVSFPWGDQDGDPGELVKYLNQTVNIQFRRDSCNVEVDEEGNPTGELILDGTGIAKAEACYGPTNDESVNEYYVSLEMTEDATYAFAQATKQQAEIGGCISIWLDHGTAWAYANNTSRYELVSAPTVNEPITDGKAIITGSGTYEEAQQLADLISAGCLPFELTAKYREISPQLSSLND